MSSRILPVHLLDEENPVEEVVQIVVPDEGTVEWIQYWHEFEGHLPTPIDVSITGSMLYRCPELKWYNFDVYPHKVKLTNTGYTLNKQTNGKQSVSPMDTWNTSRVQVLYQPFGDSKFKERLGFNDWEDYGRVVISPKWKTERPYLEGGPFLEKHVLSQIHFHWGSDMMEGSDHTVDQRRYPGEMQVTFFRSEYLTQEEALRHPDGVTMICYLIKYGVNPDARLSWVIEGFQRIQEAQKFTRIGPLPMSRLLPMFYEDYFLYWGSLETVKGDSYVIKWLVPRATLFASFEQMSEFRKLWDPWDEPNLRNYRPLQERQNRHIFFINAHWNQYNSLLPIPRVPEPSISILSPAYRKNSWMLPIQNRNNENVDSENAKVSATHFVPTKI